MGGIGALCKGLDLGMQKVGGHSAQGRSTREQSHKGGTLGRLHNSEKGSVCTAGLKKGAGRDKGAEDMLNWIMGTLQVGLSLDFTRRPRKVSKQRGDMNSSVL